MIEVEKFATDRYRLRFRGQLITLDAQALRDVYDWCLLHMHMLEQEAKQAQEAERYNAEIDARNRIARENREKPWLPGEE